VIATTLPVPATGASAAGRAQPGWPTISVVVPCYHSERTLPALVEQLARELPALSRDHEVILVNDGSRDGPGAVIGDLATRYPWVRGINLMRNFGQHNALLCGIRTAQHEVIVTMDDDLQHPPDQLPRLLAPLGQGADVVYGAPATQQHGLLRNLASRITKIVLQGGMGAETATKVSAWRAFRREVVQAFADYRNSYVSLDVLLTWGTTRFAAVPVRHEPRTTGDSNYTVGKLLRHALNMVTGFSTLPLQLASMIGFAFTLFGVVVLVYVVGRYLVQGGSVPGFSFLASAIAIFSGAQLFALGIIGEYLARVHARSMDRPTYVVRETTRPAPDADS
jgi:undecaprenyl-phosphate 4-deoxy-4-formamido-L-arabinose transferase